MAKDTNIIFRVDSDLKKRFNDFVEANGYSISQVLNASIQDILRRKNIPISYHAYLPSKIKQENKLTFIRIKKIVEGICDKYDKVEKVYLFGSFSRFEEKPTSDIDLRMETKKGFSLGDLVELKDKIVNATGREVDLLTAPPSELDPMFYNIIRKDEICIYDRSR